jgi:hypothetical protein
MPNLRWLTLTLAYVDPDIAVSLFATSNLTTLSIRSLYYGFTWSGNTYDIIRKQHKLHQLQRIELCPGDSPLCIAQVLVDAPMIRELRVEIGKAVLDTEALDGIASGRLGRYLRSLYLGGCSGHAEEWLNMTEARQRNVNSMVTQVSNWRHMITGLKVVEFWDVDNRGTYQERAAALKALGTTVT